MMPNESRSRFWLTAYELSARYPWVGAVAGLLLVAVLVPLLTLAGGYGGSLGPSIPLFFLVPILIASTLGGRVAGVIVAIAAVAVWDLFFIPPRFTPTIYSPRDLLALVVFLGDALLTGQLSTVARRRAEDAIQRARTSEALYDLSVALIGSHDPSAVLPRLTERLRTTFNLQACAVLLGDTAGSIWRMAALSGTLPDGLNIERSRNIAGVLSWVASSGQMCALADGARRAPSGLAPPDASGNRAQFWPLRVGPRLVGVLELVYKPHAYLGAEGERSLTTLVNGAAIALEQERLLREEQDAAIARESDRLKSALLSSVSHDLRTPLAGIKAAASSLLQEDVHWSEEDRRAFVADIDSESDRLARLVSNLLDLSRIEAGAITPILEWEDAGELVQRVVRRLEPALSAHPTSLDIAPGLPAARFDTVHIEQVLTNLIENAARYSPDGAPIVVAAHVHPSEAGTQLEISVTDRGPGISPAEQTRIFDTFYRVAGSGRRAGGTGMGLAIVKGLVEANGGHVEVRSDAGGGTTFTVVLAVNHGADEPEGLDTELSSTAARRTSP